MRDPLSNSAGAEKFRQRLERYVAFLRRAGQGMTAAAPDEEVSLTQELCGLQAAEVRQVLSALGSANDFETGWMGRVGLPLLGLAERDPEAALSVAGEVGPRFGPEVAECWQGEVLRITAGRERGRVFRLLNSVKPEAFLAVGRGIGRAVRTPEQAAEMLAALRQYSQGAPDGPAAERLRKGVLAGLMRGLQRIPFHEWQTWVEAQNLDRQDQAALAEGVGAYEDVPEELPPEEEMGRWLAWVKERIEPGKFPEKAAALVGGWARWFPEGAERWIAACTEEIVREAAVRGFVEQVGGDAPERAVRVAMLLPEGNGRSAALRSIERARTLKYGFYEEE